MSDTGQMEAGRELDALIAVEVLGLPFTTLGAYTPCPECNTVGRFCGARSWCHSCQEWYYSPYLDYSTDIAAAWAVVEQIALTYQVKVGSDKTAFAWWCEIGDGDWRSIGQKSAPLAVCLAAIACVRDNTPEREAESVTTP